MKEVIKSANPYMPLWEHVPDGEPRVFEYNGEKRVYVYGSHDIEKSEYCGRDQVVWSAPVDDLTNWTCHGVCYTATDGSILYAPDVVEKNGTYYLYAAEAKGQRVMVAESRNPAGPFVNPRKTELGFDPGILVDNDGRVYAYWGFCHSFCGELNDDMATLKEGTFHDHPLLHAPVPWNLGEDAEHIGAEDAFFEASSPRKIMGKYVYLYSKRTINNVPELGVFEPNNGFLSYKVSDKPLEGFKDGGDISFNGGEILQNADGSGTMTYRWGNNHGGLVQINEQWYIFYHRQTGTDEFSRQGMIEPVDVALGKDGKLYIGKITYKDGEPVSSVPVEMTSQGVQVNGLDARKWISAGYACHLHGGKKNAYIKAVYDKTDDVTAPIVNISDGLKAGYRYLQFGLKSPLTISVQIEAMENITVNVRADSHDGKIITTFSMNKGEKECTSRLDSSLLGKHAVYFEFRSKDASLAADAEIARFNRFTFDR